MPDTALGSGEQQDTNILPLRPYVLMEGDRQQIRKIHSMSNGISVRKKNKEKRE